jgi:hypothetical protein
MSRDLPARFWFETITAALGLTLFALTLVTREWFELLTGVDPDRGSGALEITLALALLAASTASALLARREYQRAAVSG